MSASQTRRCHGCYQLVRVIVGAVLVLQALPAQSRQANRGPQRLQGAAVGGFLSQNAPNQSDKQAAIPTVNAILDKYVAALGGKEAIESITSIVRVGTFEAVAAGYKGSVEIYSKLPNKFLQTVTIDGVGAISQISDGKTGWVDDPGLGARIMKPAELAQLLRLSDPHREIKYRQIYKTLTLRGKEKSGDTDAYVIEATPQSGKVDKLYFDVASGLLVRQDIVAIASDSETPAQMYYEDYRDVGGIKMPFALRQVTPALSSVIKLTDVRINVPIDDAKFARPSTF